MPLASALGFSGLPHNFNDVSLFLILTPTQGTWLKHSAMEMLLLGWRTAQVALIAPRLVACSYLLLLLSSDCDFQTGCHG